VCPCTLFVYHTGFLRRRPEKVGTFRSNVTQDACNSGVTNDRSHRFVPTCPEFPLQAPTSALHSPQKPCETSRPDYPLRHPTPHHQLPCPCCHWALHPNPWTPLGLLFCPLGFSFLTLLPRPATLAPRIKTRRIQARSTRARNLVRSRDLSHLRILSGPIQTTEPRASGTTAVLLVKLTFPRLPIFCPAEEILSM